MTIDHADELNEAAISRTSCDFQQLADESVMTGPFYFILDRSTTESQDWPRELVREVRGRIGFQGAPNWQPSGNEVPILTKQAFSAEIFRPVWETLRNG